MKEARGVFVVHGNTPVIYICVLEEKKLGFGITATDQAAGWGGDKIIRLVFFIDSRQRKDKTGRSSGCVNWVDRR